MDYSGLQEMMGRLGIYKHLGLELVSLDMEKCVMACTLQPEHSNLMGVLHGSIPFALMDTATGVCCIPHSEGEAGSATAEIKVNFIRPQRADGSRITCEARVLHLGKRTGVAEAKVLNAEGKLIAASLGSIARKPVNM